MKPLGVKPYLPFGEIVTKEIKMSFHPSVSDIYEYIEELLKVVSFANISRWVKGRVGTSETKKIVVIGNLMNFIQKRV